MLDADVLVECGQYFRDITFSLMVGLGRFVMMPREHRLATRKFAEVLGPPCGKSTVSGFDAFEGES